MYVLACSHLLGWGCEVEVQVMVQKSTPVRPSEKKMNLFDGWTRQHEAQFRGSYVVTRTIAFGVEGQ